MKAPVIAQAAGQEPARHRRDSSPNVHGHRPERAARAPVRCTVMLCGLSARRTCRRYSAGPLSANMSETATPRKFSVEGEQGLEDDERTGTSPRWTGDRGDGEGDPTAVYGGVQTEDRPGGRRVQDAGRGRGVVAARGVVLLASHDVARGAGARGTGRGAEEAGARAAGRRSARQEARRARAGDQPVEEARRTG